MKLISFYKGPALRGGAAVEGYAVDLEKASRSLGSGALPASIREILAGGPPLTARARKAVRRAEAKLQKVKQKKERRPVWAVPLSDAELGPPIPDPDKIVCIGLNYIDHCREQKVDPPARPLLFSKFPTALTGPTARIELPPETLTSSVDYEVELAFVIGREARRVKRREAMQYVAGYMALNDVTARDMQFGDKQWTRGKSLDTFAPCGPWLLTADEAPDPHNLRLWLKLNGETMQDSSTSNLVFKIPELIEFISAGITLRPGDIVSTGTPPGVGIFRKPKVLLKPGDVVEAGVEGIGSIQNRCVRVR